MPEAKTVQKTTMDVNEIMELIPHRYPFLMIDKVVDIDDTKMTLTAVKNVTINEPFFAGHYPGLPVMPGVLIVEAMAQAACVFMLRRPEQQNKVPFFASLDAVKFRRQVVPGDQLRIEVHVIRLKPRVAKCNAVAYTNGEKAAEAKLTCMFEDHA